MGATELSRIMILGARLRPADNTAVFYLCTFAAGMCSQIPADEDIHTVKQCV